MGKAVYKLAYDSIMIDISIVKWGNINQQTYLGPTSRASSIYNSGLIWLLPIKLAPMLVEFRGPPFQETPWAIPYIPFLTHHTILAFPLQWIRLDPPETHEIIMKSIIFVGENTWTSHFLSPVFVTELPPKILHETGREKWPRLPLEPRWLRSFTFCSKEVGRTQESSSDSGHFMAFGSWKKSPENEIFYPAKMILLFGISKTKIWHEKWGPKNFWTVNCNIHWGSHIAVSQENDRHFFRLVFPMVFWLCVFS